MSTDTSEGLCKHSTGQENSDDGTPEAVISTMDPVETNDEELVVKSVDMSNKDEEIESEEEIITQSIPPTEIVDTVVTTTTNPDGSLKRTTRKTTRTLMTTTRVRRIKTKSPVSNEARNPDLETELEDKIPEVNDQPPTLYTVIGPREHSQDDNCESRITQATFTFLPPTTRTEVTYEESDRDVSEIDPEAVKHLRQLRSDSKVGGTTDLQSNSTDCVDGSEQSKARTKTTVRKTVTASAATATFVATGKPKSIPGSPSNLPEGTAFFLATERYARSSENLLGKHNLIDFSPSFVTILTSQSNTRDI
ncbi:hypothetical protein P879_04367 [Paragonimus westermani]|uniref:Uncharacterized protein n=1 Tax=Paragonimus westermani TaxID=34504 RepID=A0A8T0DS94_9TREM|nr:hypothetical protein P879_04367 [Paragonimus westermani]